MSFWTSFLSDRVVIAIIKSKDIMSISITKSNQLKSIAILMMLFLHLFNRDYNNLFKPVIFIAGKPLSYYLSLFSDACVPIFAFVSGYGLYFTFKRDTEIYFKNNFKRLKKLYINYWIILLIFAVILGYVIKPDSYPGSITKFIVNFTGAETSYNGSWWFFTIYVLFVLTSCFWFNLVDKINPYLFLSGLLLIYIITFYCKTYRPNIFDNNLVHWFYIKTVLYFFTLFQFMLGVFAFKYDWNTRIRVIFKYIRYKNIAAFSLIISLIFFHGLFPNLIVAPFTGLAFILLFLQIDLSEKANKVLDYLTPHSTNLWLIHLFFCTIFFSNFIYSFRYVPIIFLVLLAVCIFSSYIVNFIKEKLLKTI